MIYKVKTYLQSITLTVSDYLVSIGYKPIGYTHKQHVIIINTDLGVFSSTNRWAGDVSTTTIDDLFSPNTTDAYKPKISRLDAVPTKTPILIENKKAYVTDHYDKNENYRLCIFEDYTSEYVHENQRVEILNESDK